MTASEFAFLAAGLVLGIASGAALIEVLRSRPPVARGVRVTVAPNAIRSRLSTTLADPHRATDPIGPARGGPGDRRWREDVDPAGEPAATGRRAYARLGSPMTADAPAGAPGGTFVLSGPAAGERTAAARTTHQADIEPTRERPAPLWLRPASGPATETAYVAVPMSMEPDPITTALRASAAAAAVAAMAGGSRSAATASALPLVASPAYATSSDGASSSRSDGLSSAAAEPTRSAATATETRPTEPSATSAQPSGEPGSGSSDRTAAHTNPGTAATGPCADERRVADERCAVATRAREGAAQVADSLRQAQRTHDQLVAASEASAAKADPRAVRAAKERAQQEFRAARSQAGTRDDVETGARSWLAEINRINIETRDASAAMDRDRAAAAVLAAGLERLAVEADAARISAERADEACVAAREAVADCDEAQALDAAAARSAETPRATSDDDEPSSRIGPVVPDFEDEFEFATPMRSGAEQGAVILRILRGDREAMQRAVARLGGDDPDARRRWQTQLGELAEALIARSIEATALDFPVDHPFWGPFTQSQNRDIAAGLSSLGFRFDGFGGWVDERQPTQRDLSLAVGYAGLDPMRVRRWPSEPEMTELLRDVRVAADEYVAGAAGGLTLGELVTLLGRRADGLTELWNQWGQARPVLLEAG